MKAHDLEFPQRTSGLACAVLSGMNAREDGNESNFSPQDVGRLGNPSDRNTGEASGCSSGCGEFPPSEGKQSLETTVIRRQRPAGRSLIDCYRLEQYFLANTQPSIKTVEASANAKVFCETFFNSLKSRIISRDERYREFENWLQNSKITLTQHESYRKTWLSKESGYLRRSRKLKIRSRCMTLQDDNTTLGDFDILRVLGKGSFGTVCLVQDRTAMSGSDSSSSERSIESRARSDQHFESPKKRVKRNHLFRNYHSVEHFRHPDRQRNHRIYAMKVIKKVEMIRNSQEGHVRAERDLLVASTKSRWMVDLVASFQDKANLYLVMEYMIGGDFLSLLIKFDTLDEKHTKWYIAEMILCVEAVHSLGWIHRDVKPDNFLISPSGHLKIADFGLAFDGHWSHDQMYYHSQRYSVLQKLSIPVVGDRYDAEMIKTSLRECESEEESYLTPREKEATLRHDPDTGNIFGYSSILQWRNGSGRRAFARSLVGTSQYMAPEVIQGLEYDGRCDWWSIGIILYEVCPPSVKQLGSRIQCIFGHAPFHAKDRNTTKKLIVSHDISLQIPPPNSARKYQEPSKSAMHLMKALLTKRKDRLSSWQYQQNDLVLLSNQSQNGHSPNQPRAFVYKDDAQDIKRHRFFSNIKWQRIHLEKPPFVPSTNSKADTKYFDQEPVSGGFESKDGSSSAAHEDELKARAGHLDGYGLGPKDRARDRILRDEVYKRDAMKLRKQHAFLGYTYHRPPSARPSIPIRA